MQGHIRLVTDDERNIITVKPMPVVNMTYRSIYREKSVVYKFVKRVFDIVASACALILLSPVFLITAIAIVAEDGGPVFFTQMRAGKDMKPFKIYKFRSMYRNAEDLFQKMQEQNEQSGHGRAPAPAGFQTAPRIAL